MHAILDERDKALFTSELDMIEDNVFVVSKSGSGMIVSDCTNDPPKGLRVFGKTEQKTYSGKNLCKITIEDGKVYNGVTFTVNADKSITVNGTPTADIYFNIGVALLEGGIEYKISGCPLFDTWNDAGFYVNATPLSGNVWNRDAESIFVMSDTKEYNCTIQFRKDLVLTNHTFYPMVRLASITDSTYEPYTGGIPSPNPEYPQELVDNQIEEIEVYGANLLDFNVMKKAENSGITVEATGDGSYTFVGTSTTYAINVWFMGGWNSDKVLFTLPAGTYYIHGIALVDGTVALNPKLPSGNAGSVVTFENDVNVTGVRATFAEIGKYYNEKIYPVIARFDGTFPYEPYKPKQSLMVSTPNGLPGIKVADTSLATYTDSEDKMWCCDEKDFERGVYVKRIGKHTINESNVKELQSINEHGIANISVNISMLNLVKSNAKCSHFREQFTTIAETVDGGFLVANETVLYLRFYSDYVSTVEECKEFLRNNVVEFYYILETPIETPLSEEELAQYKALTMNYPNTTMINNSNAHMEVDYVADIKNHIEQNYVTREEAETLLSRVSTIEEVMV